MEVEISAEIATVESKLRAAYANFKYDQIFFKHVYCWKVKEFIVFTLIIVAYEHSNTQTTESKRLQRGLFQ